MRWEPRYIRERPAPTFLTASDVFDNVHQYCRELMDALPVLCVLQSVDL
jgi:hypothetical protein